MKVTIDGQACGWKVEIPNHFACRPRSGLGVGSPQKPTPGYYSPELSAVQNLIDSSVSPCSSWVWVAAVPDRSAQRRLPWRRIRGRSSAPDDACVIPSSSALGVGASESRDAGSGPREPRRVVAHARRTRRAVSVHSCFAEIEPGGDRARLVRVARLSRNCRLNRQVHRFFPAGVRVSRGGTGHVRADFMGFRGVDSFRNRPAGGLCDSALRQASRPRARRSTPAGVSPARAGRSRRGSSPRGGVTSALAGYE